MPQVPTSTLTVLSGPSKGRVLDLDASDEYLIGSDTECSLRLEDASVSPIHARIWMGMKGVEIHDTKSPQGLFVNDARITDKAELRDGDLVWLGPPSQEGSVMLQVRLAGGAGLSAPATAAAPEVVEVEPDAFVVEMEAPAPAAPEEFVVETPPAPAEPVDEFIVEEEKAPPPAPRPPQAAPPPSPARPPQAPPPAKAAPPSAPRPAPAAPKTAPPPGPAAPSPPAAPKATTPRPKSPPKIDVGLPQIEVGGSSQPRVPSPVPVRPVVPKPAPRAARRGGSNLLRNIGIGAGAVVVLAAGAYFGLGLFGTPRITALQPARATIGDTIRVSGRNFGSSASVTIGGRPTKVTAASSTELTVVVPEVPARSGQDTPTPVVVRSGDRESEPVALAVSLRPRISSLTPEVAETGDVVQIQGAAFPGGASVRFGNAAGEVLQAEDGMLLVRVPDLGGAAPGSTVPVTVAGPSDHSEPVQLVVGRLPLITSVEPASGSPGDELTLKGYGFAASARDDDVRVGGTPALVVTGDPHQIRIVVPIVPAGGDLPLEVRMAGKEGVGSISVTVAPPADPVPFRFVPQPFVDAPGHDHAMLVTGVGPAFVLSAAGGRSAAERAVEAAARLNGAGPALAASLDVKIELRGVDTGTPSLGLTGQSEPLIEVTPEDAAGYSEDWTALGRAARVSPVRLGVWWEAEARDLVLLLIRGQKPHFAADLASEGRALTEVYQAAHRAGTAGVPLSVVGPDASASLREALKRVALRVPARVKEPKGAKPAPVKGPALDLPGAWTGREEEKGAIRFITVTFKEGGKGSLAYEGGISLSTPLQSVEQRRRDTVHFVIRGRGGVRHYLGQWDGKVLKGTIALDASNRQPIGTFELTPR